MCNFIQDCLTGDVLPNDIDDYIDKWHEGDSDVPLHTYLGMSWEEYAAWIESSDNLSYIIAARKNNINYKDAIAQAATMAARSSNINKMPEIRRWLDEQKFDV